MLLPFKLIPMMQGLAEIGLVQFATQLATTGFNPLSLFGAGEQGVWYDPSDLSTLFQDSAGTTPVTASGQPVGLMLDKSKGLVRGPELYSGGDIQTVPVGGPAFTNYSTGVVTKAGSIYEITTTLVDFVGSGSMGLAGVAGSNWTTNPVAITPGAVKQVYTATAVFTISLFSRSSNSGKFSNISIRELPGNHATQPTAASRPIYRRGDSRGVVNLLTWSEDFSNAVWVRSGVTVSAAASSAFKVDFASNFQYVQQSWTTVEGGANYAVSIEAKRNSGKCVLRLTKSDTSVLVRANLDTATQALVFKNTSGSATFTSATVTPVDAEFDRYTLVGNFTATQVFAGLMLVREASDETTITVRKAQMSKASTALPYQRNDGNLGGVATGASTDLHWLETDGVDDGMVTGNIDFTGTDKMFVCAGVRKLSDAAVTVVVELSADASANRAFNLLSDVGTFRARSTGSVSAQMFSSEAVAPVSAVVTTQADIAAPSQSIKLSGAVAVTGVASMGTGNYGNYPLYLFRRGGTSLPFNGWFYGIAITGRLTTDAETVATERYIAAKSAVVIP